MPAPFHLLTTLLDDILHALLHGGIDVFGSQWVVTAAEAGQALNLTTLLTSRGQDDGVDDLWFAGNEV